MSLKKIRPVVKIHGGKSYLAKWLISLFPEGYEQMTYCEPFCGGASVFLNKRRSMGEVISDINQDIIHIFKALRDEPKEFISRIKKIKYTERAFKSALTKSTEPFPDYIDKAVNEYCLRRMSRGGMKQTFAWSDRLRGGKPGDQNAWETMFDQLQLISDRLQGVTILCDKYVSVYKVWDETNTLTYLDPPYLHSTRSEGSTEIYDNEMSVEDHMEMLKLANAARGKVMISGYSSPLYRKYLKEWRCKKKDIANHASQAKNKERRLECLWFNF